MNSSSQPERRSGQRSPVGVVIVALIVGVGCGSWWLSAHPEHETAPVEYVMPGQQFEAPPKMKCAMQWMQDNPGVVPDVTPVDGGVMPKEISEQMSKALAACGVKVPTP